jgi:hypothetical protein
MVGLWAPYLGDLVTSVAVFVRVTLNSSYAKRHRFMLQEKASFVCSFICGGCTTDGLSNRLPLGGVHPRLMQLYWRVQCYRRQNLIGTEPQLTMVRPWRPKAWGLWECLPGRTIPDGVTAQRCRDNVGTDVTRIPSTEYLLHSSHLG